MAGLTYADRNYPLAIGYLAEWLGFCASNYVFPHGERRILVRREDEGLGKPTFFQESLSLAFLIENPELAWTESWDPRHYRLTIPSTTGLAREQAIVMITGGQFMEPVVSLDDGSRLVLEGDYDNILGSVRQETPVADIVDALIRHEVRKREAFYRQNPDKLGIFVQDYGVTIDAFAMFMDNFILKLPGESPEFGRGRFLEEPYAHKLHGELGYSKEVGSSELFLLMNPLNFKACIDACAESVGYDRALFQKLMTTFPRDRIRISEMVFPVFIRMATMGFNRRDLVS